MNTNNLNNQFDKPPMNNWENTKGILSEKEISEERKSLINLEEAVQDLEKKKTVNQQIERFSTLLLRRTELTELMSQRKKIGEEYSELKKLDPSSERAKQLYNAMGQLQALDQQIKQKEQDMQTIENSIQNLKIKIIDIQKEIDANRDAVNAITQEYITPAAPVNNTTATSTAPSPVNNITTAPNTPDAIPFVGFSGQFPSESGSASIEQGGNILAMLESAREAYIKESRIENMYEGSLAVKLKRETKLRALENEYNRLKNEYVMSLPDKQAGLEFLMAERRSCNDIRFKNGIEEKKSFKDKISNALGGITGMFNKHGYLARGLYSAASGNFVGAAMSGAMGNEFVNNKIKSFGLAVNKGLGKFMSQETADKISPFITRATLGATTAAATALIIGGMVTGGAIVGGASMALMTGLGTAVVAEGADWAMKKTILQDHTSEDILKKLDGSLDGIAAAEKMIKDTDTGNNKKIRSFIATMLGVTTGVAAGAHIHEGLINVTDCPPDPVLHTDNTMVVPVVETDNSHPAPVVNGPRHDNVTIPKTEPDLSPIPDLGSPETGNLPPLETIHNNDHVFQDNNLQVVELEKYPKYEMRPINVSHDDTDDSRDDVYDKPAQNIPKGDGFLKKLERVFLGKLDGARVDIRFGDGDNNGNHDQGNEKPQMQRTDDVKTVDKPVSKGGPEMQGTGVKMK